MHKQNKKKKQSYASSFPKYDQYNRELNNLLMDNNTIILCYYNIT